MPRLVPSDSGGDLEQPLMVEQQGAADSAVVGRSAVTVAQIQSASASDSARDRALAADSAEEEPDCRYCKEEGAHSVSGSPLIAPCSCKGSMQYVHAEPCLRLWLETRHAGDATPKCEICNEVYAITYEERFTCSMHTLCNVESWNAYLECVGVCVMIGTLVTTLWVLVRNSEQTMEFAELTNYAVIGMLSLVLVFASIVTVKKISSRWWRNNSVTTLTPT